MECGIVLAIWAGVGAPASGVEQDDLLQLTERLKERWTGDLDGMIQHNLIRVLVVENRTHYFADEAKLHGLAYDALELFEDGLNRRLCRGPVPVNVAYLITPREDPALREEGLRDLGVPLPRR
jgi:hypothetical protein